MPSVDSVSADRSVPSRRIFGFHVSPLSAHAIAQQALHDRRRTEDGVCLVITPNTDHIAKLRESAVFNAAYRRADIITCDGWPVALYAKLRGIPAGRVTGYELAAELMRAPHFEPWQRPFFVVDSESTRAALMRWAHRHGVADRTASWIPVMNFERNHEHCLELAEAVRAHGATLLIMGVGAPRSEIFISHYAEHLPPCWGFCVGQAVRVEVGLANRAPPVMQRLRMEWLYRILCEPRRLLGRYAVSTMGFLRAILDDVRNRPILRQ